MAIFWSFGQHVAALALQDLGSGSREFRFDGFGLSSGVYLYSLLAGDHVARKKLLLMKESSGLVRGYRGSMRPRFVLFGHSVGVAPKV